MKRALAWEAHAFAELEWIETRDPDLAERIRLAVERFVETGRGDVVKLTASGSVRRLRVGDWRLLLHLDRAADGTPLVVVARVNNRRDAYR